MPLKIIQQIRDLTFSKLGDHGLGGLLEIVENPKNINCFTVPYRG